MFSWTELPFNHQVEQQAQMLVFWSMCCIMPTMDNLAWNCFTLVQEVFVFCSSWPCQYLGQRRFVLCLHLFIYIWKTGKQGQIWARLDQVWLEDLQWQEGPSLKSTLLSAAAQDLRYLSIAVVLIALRLFSMPMIWCQVTRPGMLALVAAHNCFPTCVRA